MRFLSLLIFSAASLLAQSFQTACSYSITGMSWSGGVETVTTGSGSFYAGQYVSIYGIVPAAANNTNPGTTATPTYLTAGGSGTASFAVASNPGTYVSGGVIDTCVTDISPYSARINLTLSQDLWAGIQYGTSSGTYPYQTYPYCTNGVELVFSGGGGSGASGFMGGNPSFGVINFPEVITTGTGYSSAPTVTPHDRCSYSFYIASATWSSGTAEIFPDPNSTGSSYWYYCTPCSSSYGITISGAGAWNASNVVLTYNSSTGGYDYPLVSNPGSYTPYTGIISDAPGSGMTITSTLGSGATAGQVVSLTQTATGSGYHTPISDIEKSVGGSAGTRTVQLVLSGLSPNTTYHYRGYGSTSQTSTASEFYSNDFTFTTAPACIGPCVATLPTVSWDPTTPANYPTFPTTGCSTTAGTPPYCYTIVPMKVNGSTGEYVAASNVGPITYGGTAPGPTSTWSVSTNDTFQTVLKEVGYGARIQLPQSSSGLIPIAYNYCTVNSYQGYYELCAKSPDPLATGGINDPNARWIVVETVQNTPADFPPVWFQIDPTWTLPGAFVSQNAVNQSIPAQHFITESLQGYPAHHYWFQNITEKVASGNGLWTTYNQIGNGEGDSNQMQNPPSYIVFDHVNFVAPARVGDSIISRAAIFAAPLGHFAVVNSYASFFDGNNENWFVAFQNCGSGPIILRNNYYSTVYAGIYFENTGTLNCNGYTIPTSVQSMVAERNYDYVVIQRNRQVTPLSTCNTCIPSTWDGLDRPAFRQTGIESKGGNYWLIDGNSFDGSFTQQTYGEVIAITSINSVSTGETGAHDITISNNIFKHAAAITTLTGVRSYNNGGVPQGAVTANVHIVNNSAFALSKYHYGLGIGSGFSYVLLNTANGVTLERNTFSSSFGYTNAYITSWFLNQTGTPLSSSLSVFNNNIALDGLASGQPTGTIWTGLDLSCCQQTYPVAPIISASNSSNSALVYQNGFIGVGPSGIIQSQVLFGGNVIFPQYWNGASTVGYGLNDSQASSMFATNPTSSPADRLITAGSTCTSTQSTCYGLHQQNAGLVNIDSGDPTCSTTTQQDCHGGVNTRSLENALGVVSQISWLIGSGSIQFSFLAPDANGVAVDVSSNSGATWTRCTNGVVLSGCSYTGAGTQNQTVTFTGLTASTTYTVRILGYYSQTASTFSIPWDSSNLVTDGFTLTTAASGTRTVSMSFSLPSGATTATYTVTPIGGSALSPVVCSSSPCSISGVANGAYSASLVFKNSGGASVYPTSSFSSPQ